MAMFPPAPPNNFEMHPGCEIFKREEKAFFAQAGKEIVRVRVEFDFPHGNEPDVLKQRSQAASPPWPINGSGPGPAPYTSQFFPPPASNKLPPNVHSAVLHQTTSGLRTPPEDTMPPNSSKPKDTEEYNPDEAWRRPMPYAERRRAGKHTRRVIVRS
jgi:hypothetical protein